MKGSAYLLAFALSLALVVPAKSQVVQLPTFQQFSVSTSVMVPDSGGGVIGGIDSARESEIAFGGLGPLRNRATGREMHSSRVGVSARIIDTRKLDEAILASAGGVTAEDLATFEKSDRVTRGVSSTASSGIASVSALKRERSLKQRAQQQEVLEFVERGDAMHQEGKVTTAKAFYRMALKRTTDQNLRKNIGFKLAKLEKQ